MKKIFTTGNEACAEGSIRAGCKFYAGYPITPQNEFIAYMSHRMEEAGGAFVQSESELAAINMVFGAAATGTRAMTSSSSPGISLMQEGISFLAGAQLPAVIVNVMRGGPGLGNIAPSQSDYFQATKGGGHGDYHLIVLAPWSIQEMYEMPFLAFELAEKYNNPVMILSDGIIGQMMEPLILTSPKVKKEADKSSWALTGAKGREPHSIKSLYLKDGVLEDWNAMLQKKYKAMEKNEKRYETHGAKDADIVIVAYGSMARLGYSVCDALNAKGKKAKLFRPISLWPFPSEALKELDNGKTRFFVIEMSEGQMLYDVKLAIGDDKRVSFYGRMGGGVPEEDAILDEILKK